MALFGFGKKNKNGKTLPVKKETSPERKLTVVDASRPGPGVSSAAILGTRVTEKATLMIEKGNAYTFNVEKKANKKEIEAAITKLYKVHPVKVRIVNVPSKQVFVRGKWGVKTGGRKAYVYLKHGEKIEIA